ncbi:MAG: response regulator transcription factor [Anaerolineales bacterium]|nr:response regulator transcription factor [Anaerolineales bacterium]
MTKILIIDDDRELCDLVVTILEKDDYQVKAAYSGKEGIQVTKDFQPDLILLDVMMPGESGWEVCEKLRQTIETPIIFLSARGAESDIVRGLKLGADDYISKPFRRFEMTARIEAVLRRANQPDKDQETIYQSGDLVIDPSVWEVRRGDQDIHLTPTEFELLHLLARNAGKPVAHQLILTTVWGDEHKDNLNILKVYIRQLRTKIEPDPDHPIYLLTKRGFGYFLAEN